MLEKESREEFLGQFPKQKYTITRKYIETERQQVQLYLTKYSPVNPKFTLVILHGLGERSACYAETADFFACNEFEVIVADQRGTGYSGGPRYNNQIRDFENDALFMIKEANPELPLFLHGHSLGGLITTRFMLDFRQVNVSGCFLSAPALGIAQQLGMTEAKKKIISWIGSFLSDFSVTAGIGVTTLTRKKQKIYDIFNVSMWDGRISAKMLKSIILTLSQTEKQKQKVNFPIMIFFGDSDLLADYRIAQKFIDTNPQPYKKFHLFPGVMHEMKYDQEKEEFFNKSLQFIKSIQSMKPLGKVTAQPLKKPEEKSNPLILVLMLGLFVLIIARLIGFI